MFGDPLTIPVPDLDRTDHLLMLGANPLESNGSLCSAPDFPGRLKAIRARGGKVVVVDPRRTRTAALADEHLFIRPGTDAFLLMALVHTLFAEELTSPPSTWRDASTAWTTCAPSPSTSPPSGSRDVTGVPAETIRRTARELAAAGRAAVYGRIGTCTQAYGTLNSWLVDALNVLTGNLDRPGGAMFPRPAHAPVYRPQEAVHDRPVAQPRPRTARGQRGTARRHARRRDRDARGGAGQGADHHRREPGAVGAERPSGSTARSPGWSSWSASTRT